MAFYTVTIEPGGDAMVGREPGPKQFFVVEDADPIWALASLRTALTAESDEETAHQLLYEASVIYVRPSAYDPLEDDEVPPRTEDLGYGVRRVHD